MEEKTVYSGVLTPTLKLLYTSAGEIQDNKDRIFKLIKRLSQTLNDSYRDVLCLDLNKYSTDMKARFFARWILMIEREEFAGKNRELLSNIEKMDWSIHLDDILAYNLSCVCNKDEGILRNEIQEIRNAIDIEKHRLRDIIRHQERGTRAVYEDLKKALPEYCWQGGFPDTPFDERLLAFIQLEEIMTDFFWQIIVYHITDNQSLSIQTRLEKLSLIAEKIRFYQVQKSEDIGKGDIFIDFSIKLAYLNRRKELMTSCKVLNLLMQQIEGGYSMEVPSIYRFEKKIIEIPIYGMDYIKIYIESKGGIQKTLCGNDLEGDDFTQETAGRCVKKILETRNRGTFDIIADISDIQHYILEREEKGRKSDFRENLKRCWNYCMILKKYEGRMLEPFYLQHIKNIYREILVDKLKSPKFPKIPQKTARTIMEEICDEIKLKPTDSAFFLNEKGYFVLEKLNRGFFRERGIGKLYTPKSNVEKLYYERILEIYQLPSLDMEMSELRRFIYHMHEVCMGILE